ncbi:MAG: S1 RNA-binding domain-containing protein [Anaerolineales bacterium]|nr:S1 RNA-binding domain-containing protein [Anaerolineales bacterium]
MEFNEENAGKKPIDEEMTEKAEHPMDALLDSVNFELDTPRRGEIRTGTIARVTDSDILVDIGAKSEGVIPARELEQLSAERRAELAEGQTIDVYIERMGGGDGAIQLSLSRAEQEQDWRVAEELLENQEPFEGLVAGYNKGGLIVKLGGLRAFIPASQVSLSRRRRAEGDTPDRRWGGMVGEAIIAKVVEVDRRRNRLILSERSASREARNALKERLIDDLKPGEVRSGHIVSLADFGAFVDIGGADGLVHLSELSWKRIAHPREVLKVGEKVDVKVLGVDPDRKRISLSIRETQKDPWESIVEKIEEGQLVEGHITKLTKFGAFASIDGLDGYEIEGLIHISELADQRIEHPQEVVQEGQQLALRVINIDRERRRIGLSVKKVDSVEFAEQDYVTAMKEMEEAEQAPREAEAVVDFDAALDEEAVILEEATEAEPAESGEAIEVETVPSEDAADAEPDVEDETPVEAPQEAEEDLDEDPEEPEGEKPEEA